MSLKQIRSIGVLGVLLGLALLLTTSCILQGYQCRSSGDCAVGEQCDLGLCKTSNPLDVTSNNEKAGFDGGNQKPTPNGACSFPGGKCPRGYYCDKDRCRYDQDMGQFCNKYTASLKNILRPCQAKVQCTEDSGQCTEQELKDFEKLLQCASQVNQCNFEEVHLHHCMAKLNILRRKIGCYIVGNVVPSPRHIPEIGGAPACDRWYNKGAKGQVPLRLIMEVSDGKPMPFEYLVSSPVKLMAKDIVVEKVELLDPATMKVAAGKATAFFSQHTFKVHVNPLAKQAKQSASIFDSAPRATQFLVEMSKDSLWQDYRSHRTYALSHWAILDALVTQPFSVVSTLLFQGTQTSEANLQSRHFNDLTPYLGDDKKNRGFFMLDQATRDAMSVYFLSTGNPLGKGEAPLHDAILRGVTNVRAVMKKEGKFRFNPAVITWSLTEDVSVTNKGLDSALRHPISKVKAAVKGNGKDNFVSFMTLANLYYKKDSRQSAKPTEAAWKKHIDSLCSIAQSSTDGSGVYWGQVLPLHDPNQLQSSREQIIAKFKMATLAMEGFVAMDLNYHITGATPGQRYIVAVTLSSKWNTKKSTKNHPIYFEVTP